MKRCRNETDGESLTPISVFSRREQQMFWGRELTIVTCDGEESGVEQRVAPISNGAQELESAIMAATCLRRRERC